MTTSLIREELLRPYFVAESLCPSLTLLLLAITSGWRYVRCLELLPNAQHASCSAGTPHRASCLRLTQRLGGRRPQTTGGWGHRRGGHQQFRTHEHECLVGADGQDDKDAVGTLGRRPRTTSRLGMAVEFAVMGPLNSCRAPTFSVAHGPMDKLSTRRWGLSSHSGHIHLIFCSTHCRRM